MRILKLTLSSALPDFGHTLVGDAMFAHLCRAIRRRDGEARLVDLLRGYCTGRPFAVLSDAFPAGHLPKPVLPELLLAGPISSVARKEWHQLSWLPALDHTLPLASWLEKAVAIPTWSQEQFTHRMISAPISAPNSNKARVFPPKEAEKVASDGPVSVDIYAILDSERLSQDEFLEKLGNVCKVKRRPVRFLLEAVIELEWPPIEGNCAMTLAPCAPDATALDASRCFYRPLTRFGGHSEIGRGWNIDRTILLAQTGAVLRFRSPTSRAFHGKGLGGEKNPISTANPQAVQQGYAPLIPLNLVLHS